MLTLLEPPYEGGKGRKTAARIAACKTGSSASSVSSEVASVSQMDFRCSSAVYASDVGRTGQSDTARAFSVATESRTAVCTEKYQG